jgi:hypothetical protein
MPRRVRHRLPVAAGVGVVQKPMRLPRQPADDGVQTLDDADGAA